jgi:hypothetical protein
VQRPIPGCGQGRRVGGTPLSVASPGEGASRGEKRRHGGHLRPRFALLRAAGCKGARDTLLPPALRYTMGACRRAPVSAGRAACGSCSSWPPISPPST